MQHSTTGLETGWRRVLYGLTTKLVRESERKTYTGAYNTDTGIEKEQSDRSGAAKNARAQTNRQSNIAHNIVI